jgi:hypothetical protein
MTKKQAPTWASNPPCAVVRTLGAPLRRPPGNAFLLKQPGGHEFNRVGGHVDRIHFMFRVGSHNDIFLSRAVAGRSGAALLGFP